MFFVPVRLHVVLELKEARSFCYSHANKHKEEEKRARGMDML